MTERYLVVGVRPGGRGSGDVPDRYAGVYRSFRRADGDARAWSVDGWEFYVYPIRKAGAVPCWSTEPPA